MKSQKQIDATLNSIDYTQNTRVYFENRERTLAYGKFVRCGDYEELLLKGFVRFVSESKLEQWDETGNIALSKVMLLSEIRFLVTDSQLESRNSNFEPTYTIC